MSLLIKGITVESFKYETGEYKTKQERKLGFYLK
jgi:hypothetical protein